MTCGRWECGNRNCGHGNCANASKEQLHTFNTTGKVEFETYAEARAFARTQETSGRNVHANIPLPSLNMKASVEECQGAHCHCRY